MLKNYVSYVSHKINFKDLGIQWICLISEALKDSRLQGDGAKDKNYPHGEGYLEESHSRRSHLGG